MFIVLGLLVLMITTPIMLADSSDNRENVIKFSNWTHENVVYYSSSEYISNGMEPVYRLARSIIEMLTDKDIPESKKTL